MSWKYYRTPNFFFRSAYSETSKSMFEFFITQSMATIKRHGTTTSPCSLPMFTLLFPQSYHHLLLLNTCFDTEYELYLSLDQGLRRAVESWIWHCSLWTQRLFWNPQTRCFFLERKHAWKHVWLHQVYLEFCVTKVCCTALLLCSLTLTALTVF